MKHFWGPRLFHFVISYNEGMHHATISIQLSMFPQWIKTRLYSQCGPVYMDILVTSQSPHSFSQFPKKANTRSLALDIRCKGIWLCCCLISVLGAIVKRAFISQRNRRVQLSWKRPTPSYLTPVPLLKYLQGSLVLRKDLTTKVILLLLPMRADNPHKSQCLLIMASSYHYKNSRFF